MSDMPLLAVINSSELAIDGGQHQIYAEHN